MLPILWILDFTDSIEYLKLFELTDRYQIGFGPDYSRNTSPFSLYLILPWMLPVLENKQRNSTHNLPIFFVPVALINCQKNPFRFKQLKQWKWHCVVVCAIIDRRFRAVEDRQISSRESFRKNWSDVRFTFGERDPDELRYQTTDREGTIRFRNDSDDSADTASLSILLWGIARIFIKSVVTCSLSAKAFLCE